MSPIRVSCSQEIASTPGQCFKRSWGGFAVEGRFVWGQYVYVVALDAAAPLCRELCSLVSCSFPKSLAFCSASARWDTSPPPNTGYFKP